jgi:hypothetical protein
VLLSFIHLLLDPAGWSIIFVTENAASEIGDNAVSRLWVFNNYFCIGKVAFMLAGHVKLYYDYLHDRKLRAESFAQMGEMDATLQQILKDNHVRFHKDGTIANMKTYAAVING